MPGVIGASIFSPRPARGYRFHSLQVEIIVVLSQFLKPQSFSSKHTVRHRLFVLQSECLTTKPGCENQYPVRISWISPEIADDAPRSTANANYGSCCSSVSPTPAAITRSRRCASSSRARLREVAAGRKIGRFQKITEGDPMQNQAQIDQLLRQKSDA